MSKSPVLELRRNSKRDNRWDWTYGDRRGYVIWSDQSLQFHEDDCRILFFEGDLVSGQQQLQEIITNLQEQNLSHPCLSPWVRWDTKTAFSIIAAAAAQFKLTCKAASRWMTFATERGWPNWLQELKAHTPVAPASPHVLSTNVLALSQVALLVVEKLQESQKKKKQKPVSPPAEQPEVLAQDPPDNWLTDGGAPTGTADE